MHLKPYYLLDIVRVWGFRSDTKYRVEYSPASARPAAQRLMTVGIGCVGINIVVACEIRFGLIIFPGAGTHR